MKGIQQKIEQEYPCISLNSFKEVYRANNRSSVHLWALAIIGATVISIFLPWTQNIRASGRITSLRQEFRAQEVNSIISGKIIKWYVTEGAFVNAGDTLAVLAEVKDAYLDPKLLARTREQINAKNNSVEAYGQKIRASESQINALHQSLDLKVAHLQNKVEQLQLKIIGDSMEMLAANNDFRIAEAQYNRQKIMRDSGLASLAQVEQRAQSYQSAMAKKVSAGIRFTNTKTDLINTGIEQQGAVQEYSEKVAKAQGERASALGDRSTGEGEASKLESQFSNYSIRAGQYYIKAPQSGQIMAATKSGINEMVKEGEKLMEIVPAGAAHAVELFIRPLDRTLLHKGQKVNFVFDGYPAIVFSGWPEASSGTFSGVVSSIETNVGSGGKFRVLVAEDKQARPWPVTLNLGGGAQGIALLNNVPIWYELWRNINGFPPDFYATKEEHIYENKK